MNSKSDFKKINKNARETNKKSHRFHTNYNVIVKTESKLSS